MKPEDREKLEAKRGRRLFLGRYRTFDQIVARILKEPVWKGAKVSREGEFTVIRLKLAEMRLKGRAP